jgi:hypothetical protein
VLNFSKFATSIMKNSVGYYNGNPRIYNVDRSSYSIGFSRVNVDATSPFARTKVNKLWLEGGTDCQEGDLIQDRVDGKYHLVMSLKAEFSGGAICYWDGTSYLCNATATVKRHSTTKDEFFGMETSGFTVVATGVQIMVNPQNFSTNDMPEMTVQTNKIKVAVQGLVGVQEKDRIITSLGDQLIVENIDKSSLKGIWILMCDSDIR